MGLRDAAQQALEALQYPLETSSHAFDADKAELLSHRAIDALRAALAEQDSVAAWENKYEMKEWQVHAIRAGWMPAPTPRKPLTDEEILDISDATVSGDYWHLRFARAVIAAYEAKQGEQT